MTGVGWAIALIVLSAASLAADADDAAVRRCVEVRINGRAAVPYGCLNQALSAAPSATPPPSLQRQVADEPSNRQVGQYNFSALSHRMGRNLGRSALPQRPPPPVMPPLLGRSPGH